MDLQAFSLGHGAQQGDGRPLAIGSGEVNDRRQSVLRSAQGFADAQHPIEIEVDQLGMQGLQPLKRRIEGQETIGHRKSLMFGRGRACS